MNEGCAYFELDSYADSPDRWDDWEWPGKVWQHIRGRPLDALFDDLEDVEGVLGRGVADGAWPDATPAQLVDDANAVATRDVVAGWVQTVDSAPEECPRDAAAETAYCAFHHAPGRLPSADENPVDQIADSKRTDLVGANFDRLDLRDVLVESGTHQTLRLDFCTVNRLDLDRAVVEKNLSMQYAAVGELSFEHATFEKGFDVSHSRIRGGLYGAHAVFRGQVYGVDAAFRCADAVDLEECIFERYVCFDDATFASGLSLWNGVFRADAEFRFASFGGAVDGRWVDFHRFPDFHSAAFDTRVDFGGATFYDDAGFSEIEFGGDAHFQSDYNSFKEYAAVFHGVVDFTKSTVAGDFNLRETEFKKYASFRHLDVAGEVTMWNAEFDEDADFFEASFADEVDLRWAKFHGYGDFNEVQFAAPVNFGGVRFNDDVGFSESHFADDVLFRGEFSGYDQYKSKCQGVVDFGDATFEGAFDANVVFDDDVSFANTSFLGDVDLAARFEGVADLTDAEFHGAADLSGVQFRDEAVFERVTAAEPIDASGAVIRSGVVSQPAVSTTYYDFSRATFGAVDLEPKDDPELFDYCKFCETSFDGFDFPQHGTALIGNWRIHEFVADDASLNELINTYLKAKNGANDFGAKTASSEFFIREMRFRRKKHFDGARNGGPLSRLLSAGHWVSNWFLNLSCGYGERPLRTVSFSAVIIFAFALVYSITGLNGEGTPITYLLVSTQTFVTLIFGDTPQASTTFVQFIAAVQGFTGAFFIALFVFALTRSIHR